MEKIMFTLTRPKEPGTTQKILVIDDSTTIQLMVKSFLKEISADLTFASDGVEGIRLAQALAPDLILLDVEMPAPNGFEVCRQLKLDPKTSGVPIIFLTAAESTTEKVRGLDLGATDYVTKPVDPAELCARVRASLRTKYMTDLLARKAMLDGLTGLWNRAYLEQFLASEASLGRRHGHICALIMADVDCFKSINDQHGHPFGDEVLRHVARTIVTGCRREDVVCRYGGEEFAIVTPLVTVTGATALAEHLREAISGLALRHRDTDVSISCSFGVAEVCLDADASPYEKADAALYRAKRAGRNCVVSADLPETDLYSRGMGGPPMPRDFGRKI
jgi:diguanylate cyclase (GGDEF)-like protein